MTPVPRAPRSRRRSRHARAIRRRRLLAAVVMLALAGALLTTARSLTAASGSRVVALRLGGHSVGQARLDDFTGRPLSPDQIAASLPSTVTVRAGAATIVYLIDRRRAARRIRASRDVTALAARPLSASIRAPVIAQRLRDNCETAALQVLLASTGVRVEQLVLQRQLAHSGPLDPQGAAAAAVWGDPDEGFVGRADGSGAWGGFGVYPRPVAALAARHGRRLRDLTATPPSAIYRELLAGHAVLAWIGLRDGPYRSWRTADGQQITVNLNEHTIVLSGIRPDGTLQVINVLSGTRELWPKASFERSWELLGRRALATT